jgi:uncharacterized membrane protein YkgB
VTFDWVVIAAALFSGASLSISRATAAVTERTTAIGDRLSTASHYFRWVRQAMEKDIMIKDFNVSERGHGSYWLFGILRWVMVVIFISFGIQKFTPESADGIALYISNSPFVSWLSIFGIRGEAYLLGIIELTTATLLAAGAFIPILSALGSLMGIGTFAITWSFFFTTPGVVKWSVSTDPIAWNLTGEFLYKDVVLLCVCIVLFLASLPKKVVPLRSH